MEGKKQAAEARHRRFRCLFLLQVQPSLEAATVRFTPAALSAAPTAARSGILYMRSRMRDADWDDTHVLLGKLQFAGHPSSFRSG